MARNGFNGIGAPGCNPETGCGMRSGQSTEIFEQTAKKAAERHLKSQLQKENVDALKSFAALGCQLRLITTPFHKSYRNEVESDSLWNFTRDLCRSLALESTLVSYEDWSDLPLPDSAFWDADHLNDYGAEIFSEKLFGLSALDSLLNALQLP
jgi:hypothetical protein